MCTTWDIFHEKLGWMLIYWNMCGVPLAYSFQSVFILHHGSEINHSDAYLGFLFGTLFIAYYVWDTANSQVQPGCLRQTRRKRHSVFFSSERDRFLASCVLCDLGSSVWRGHTVY